MKRTFLGLLMVVMLITSLLPLSLAGEERNEQETFKSLLSILDVDANYTAKVLANSTPPAEAIILYENASELRKRAWELYSEGNYTGAVHLALEAMHLYKATLLKLREGAKEGNDTINRIKIEILITERTLNYANKTIRRFCTPGMDCTVLMERYNETLKALQTIEKDLERGNYSAINPHLKELSKSREMLSEAIEETMRETVAKNANKLLEAQLKTIDYLILKLSSLNSTDPKVKARLEALKEERAQIVEIMKENNPRKALEILKSLRLEAVRTMRLIEREKREGESKPEMPSRQDGNFGGEKKSQTNRARSEKNPHSGGK